MTHRRVRGALAGAKRRLPPGTSPGTIRVDPASPAPIITAIAYGPEGDVVERRVAAGELAALKGSAPILWVNIEGLGDAEAIREIGRVFGLHPLALEDAVNVHQRPKVDAFAGNLFIVARMADEAEGRLCTEQLGLFLGEGFVLTFQERRGDCFDPVRNRLRLAGPIRAKGADYLAYALLDAVVDNWFPALDKCEERIDVLDRVVPVGPPRETIRAIHDLRADLVVARRAIWPLRDALAALVRDQHPLVREDTRLYLRDCQDHVVQLIDVLETSRELSGQLAELHLSFVSNRLNEVMKVLTVISTIFLPLSFIAGLYGMNFQPEKSPWNMPELGWRYGYPFALLLMAAIVVAMLWYFARRGWLSSSEPTEKP